MYNLCTNYFIFSIINFQKVANNVVGSEDAFFCEAKMPVVYVQKLVFEVRFSQGETIKAVLMRKFVEWDAFARAKSRHDEFVVERRVAEQFRLVRHIVLGADICLDVRQVGSSRALSVVGMSARTKPQIGYALPVTAVVATASLGLSKVTDFVVLEAGCCQFVADLITGSPVFFSLGLRTQLEYHIHYLAESFLTLLAPGS